MRLRLLAAALLLGLPVLLPIAQAAGQPANPVPMRLPASVQPLAYNLHLQVDPDQPRHQGEVEIRLQLHQPVPARGAIRLHAKGLQLREVWLETGARRWRGKATQVDAERVDLRFGQPLAAGPAQLQISFAGPITERNVYGLFRQQEAGPDGVHWAAFTQFQATGARQAFPLFDEPGWKVPWTLSLTVPQALVAASNMPVASEEAARPGFKRVTFQPSPPMPSYLLAFGVGRFDVVDAGLVVLVSLISPYRADRDLARSLVPAGDFLEVFVDTPVAVCEQRDPKGLYAKVRAGAIKNFTGIDSPYEPPLKPELRITTVDTSAQDAAETIAALLGAQPGPQ